MQMIGIGSIQPWQRAVTGCWCQQTSYAAPPNRQQRVKQRHAHRQHGHTQTGHEGSLGVGGDGQRGQRKAEEQAARIAQKKTGRITVIPQETEAGPHQSQENQHIAGCAAKDQRKTDTGSGNQGNAGGQTIHAINQVEGIHQGHKPDHGGHGIHPRRKSVTKNVLQMDAGCVSGHGQQNLSGQFRDRLKIETVIQQAQQDHARA